MNIAIIGSRNFTDYELMSSTILSYLAKNELKKVAIVSGGAKGADTLAEKFAFENHLEITVFKPDWKKFGKRAGFLRNTIIIENADIVFAFWDGISNGTKDSIDKSEKLKKEVIITVFNS